MLDIDSNMFGNSNLVDLGNNEDFKYLVSTNKGGTHGASLVLGTSWELEVLFDGDLG